MTEILHGYTAHGHPCCGRAAVGDRPTAAGVLRRCGGTAHCEECVKSAARIHDAPSVTVQVCRAIDTESRIRLGQLDNAHGCEASSEREYHRGRLTAVAEILSAVNG